MDAGARGRRLLQRREYKAKVSDFVPKELEDHVVYEQNPNTNMFPPGTQGKVKRFLDKGTEVMNKNKILRTIGNIFKSGNPGSNYTPSGKVPATNSFEPEGEMIEANSDQMKAMHDAKMKKMEDDKVAAKKKKVDEACWKGYEKKGMKTMFGKRYPNCVKKTKKEEVELEAKKSCGEGEYYCYDEQKCKPIPDGMKVGKDGMLVKEDMKGMSQKSGDKRSTDSGAGMTAKGVAKYNRRTGGNLKTAVTTPPSKLKAGSKAAKRRKSFCARSKSWTGPRGKAARRRWNCEYEPELPMIDEKKKLYNTAPLSDRVSNWSKKINEGDSYVKSDRNKFGLPKDLKSVEKKVGKKTTTGVNYGAMAQSYEPQGEMIEMARKGKGAINTDVLKNNPNLDPLKPGDYIKLKRLSAKVDKINEVKKLNPNAIFPTVANVKIKNEIISDTGISTRNQKKKFGEAKMTPTQKEKKEKYVKGMKKDKGGFTKRYGKDGKSVMYATATKMAMKKEETVNEMDNMGSKVGIGLATTVVGGGLELMRRAKNAAERIRKKKTDSLKVEAKVDKGKDDAAKRNERNQRTFGNRRDSKGGMTHSDDTEARRYNTKKGRGVKMKGK